MDINLGVSNYNFAQNIQNKAQTNKIDSKLKSAFNKDQFIRSGFEKNNDNLKFNIQKIKFFKEDEEKMAKMSLEDKINYKIKLKSENRYTLA